ncbi:hypothetical protein LZ32DRAFT_236471 [Colletotrichum eremochloae]|nr:hypothetical protein LY78DRAFT_298409 [Colletotrichum sublineola]KAK2013895.1 hypothetical protein LZ32DRAFT_236471 [Colletotrichum eremochloae]
MGVATGRGSGRGPWHLSMVGSRQGLAVIAECLPLSLACCEATMAGTVGLLFPSSVYDTRAATGPVDGQPQGKPLANGCRGSSSWLPSRVGREWCQ